MYQRVLIDSYGLVGKLDGPFTKGQAEVIAQTVQQMLQDQCVCSFGRRVHRNAWIA